MTRFDRVIPPGSEGKVFASIDISHVKGAIQKHVEIETSDPVRSKATLYVKANVKTYIDIAPEEQVRFTVMKGEANTQELTITPNPKIQLHDASVDSNLFAVKLTPPDAKGKLRLFVTVKNTAAIGTQQATVRLAVDGIPTKEITIPVFAIVRGPISVNPQVVSFLFRTFPEEVNAESDVELRKEAIADAAPFATAPKDTKLRVLGQKEEWYRVIYSDPKSAQKNQLGWVKKASVKGTVDTDDSESKTVSIQKVDGKSFKMLDYSTNLTQIKVERVPEDPKTSNGTNYSLKVSLVGIDRTRKANVNGSLIVKTDDANQPEVKIPVYIIVS